MVTNKIWVNIMFEKDSGSEREIFSNCLFLSFMPAEQRYRLRDSLHAVTFVSSTLALPSSNLNF